MMYKAIAAIFTNNSSFYQFFFSWFIIALLLHLLIKTYLLKLQPSPPHAPPSPPSPPALPLIGHLHLITPVLVTCFQALSRRYGPLVHLRIGASSCVVACTSAVAEEIFKTHEPNFISRPEFGASEYFIYKGSRFVMAQYGDYWRFMKKLTMTKLLSRPQLEVFADIRRDEVAKLVERIAASSREGKACDLSFEVTTLTNNIIGRMALSTRCCGDENEAQEIKDLVWGINRLAGKLSVGDVLGALKVLDFSGNGRKFVATLQRFDRLVEKIMKEHEEKGVNGDERKDLLDILLEIYRDPAAEMKLTRKDIKSFLLDIFMAGTDTTSTAVQWAMGELLNRPEAFQTLRQEIISAVGSNKPIQESDVSNLPYLNAVIMETLRLHPSAPLILRESRQDCQINGSLIKAKTRVIVNAYAVMRDPDSWSEPDRFKPERFMEGWSERAGDDRMEVKGKNMRFIPFGSGKRGCPGSSLAMRVMPCAVAALVQRFDWRVGTEGVDLTLGPGFAAEMAAPIVCYADCVAGSG